MDNNKKTIIIVVSIISATIIILALIFAFVFFGSISLFKNSMHNPDLDTNVTVNTEDTVEVLPQIERDKGGEYEGKDPFADNILEGAKVIETYDTYGYKSVIIQTKRETYTLYVGDTVGDSDWVVSEITDNTVTFISGDKTLTLTKE